MRYSLMQREISLIEDSIEKVRRTATDQLLIVLNHKIGDKMGPLQQRMADVLKSMSKLGTLKRQPPRKR